MTCSHPRGSFVSSSSFSASCTPSPDIPKLALLSCRSGPVGRSPSRVLNESPGFTSSMLSPRGSPRPGPTSLPPLMLPSSVFRISWSSLLVPSTMAPPFRFFQLLAASSSTRSARPSSRHPDPQCRPMKEASSWRAVDVRVKECFLVNVRKARGRRVAGGRIIGRMPAFGALTLNGFNGCTGVAKDGEDEGSAEEGMWTFFRRNMGAGVLSIFATRILSRKP